MNATSKQIEFVVDLVRRNKLNPDWFAGYCRATFGGQPEQMDARTCSALIGELQDWIEHPEKLLRAQGQATLFEVGS